MEYHEFVASLGEESPYGGIELDRDSTALLCIDAQVLVSIRPLLDRAVARGISVADASDALADMDRRISAATARLALVLEAFRERGMMVINTRVQSSAPDCSDAGALHKRLGLRVPPGHPYAEFLPGAEPRDGEIVLPKTCSSVFVGTAIDTLLRNTGVTTLVIVGFFSEQCVTTSARHAADIGYTTIVVEDAVDTSTQEIHEQAMDHIRDLYACLVTADELMQLLPLPATRQPN